MARVDDIRVLAEPIVAGAGAALYDVVLTGGKNGGKLVVSVTRDGGVDLEVITDISRQLNTTLDEADLIGGTYTLEVSSPGLERTLRTREHFAGAVDETVTVRTTGTEGARRVRGQLTSAGAETIEIVIDEADGTNAVGDTVTIAHDNIQSARTVFVWGDRDGDGA